MRIDCVRVGTLAASLFLVTLVSPNALPAVEFEAEVRPILQAYCVDCHGTDDPDGGLDVESLSSDFEDSESAQKWIEILDRVNLNEMPPADSDQPSEQELIRLTDQIGGQLSRMRAHSESTGGRVLLRRLTRLEYTNTVRDLLDVEFVPGESPIDLLPPDGSIRGFDRNSKALLVDPSLLDAYLRVAEIVAERAIRFRPPPVQTRTIRFEFRDTVGSAMDYLIRKRTAYIDADRLVLMNSNARTFGKLRHPFNNTEVPVTANYRIRVKASATPGSDGEPVYMSVKQGPGEPFAQVRVDAPMDRPNIYEFVTTRDALFQGEYEVGIVGTEDFSTYVQSRGPAVQAARKAFEEGRLLDATRLKARMRAQGDYDNNIRGAFRPSAYDLSKKPKLYLDWIEVTGPLQGDYPPKSMTNLFPANVQPESITPKQIRAALAKIMPRAFRRRVTPKEVDSIMRLVQTDLAQGASNERAIRTGIVGILCSPAFLYLYEPNPDGTEPSRRDPRRLTQMELASRLSYFLWSSKPDDRLFSLALKDQLAEPKTLRQVVDEMLDDERAEGFVQGFVRQWLKVEQFHRFPADERIFPEYFKTEFAGVDQDISQQPLEMIREILRNDLSTLVLLESDWTMLNERLAAYYGIPGVAGDEFRRVALPTQSDNGQPSPAESEEACWGWLVFIAGAVTAVAPNPSNVASTFWTSCSTIHRHPRRRTRAKSNRICAARNSPSPSGWNFTANKRPATTVTDESIPTASLLKTSM